MNNLHFTNFQARQDVNRTFRYRFAPRERPVSRQEVRVFGRDLAEPLQARQYRGPFSAEPANGLSVEPADEVLCELRPVGDHVVRARLRNVSDRPITAHVRWRGHPVHTEGGDGGVAIPALGTADVMLRRER
ncbi:hypothetical protein [Paramicrobacterium humi]|uniref:hypothetical protein n=1 Tax=Paramicrobacterium humi TaxID=640635 RepID=UPI000AEC68B7|nr:hypothetical protein [Microbacterium humi]